MPCKMSNSEVCEEYIPITLHDNKIFCYQGELCVNGCKMSSHFKKIMLLQREITFFMICIPINDQGGAWVPIGY